MTKKKIPVEQLQKDARAKGVSVYLLIKRFLNYRKIKVNGKENCCNCKASEQVAYYNKDAAIQCVWIGIMRDFYADVNALHICNYYERGCKYINKEC